MLPHVSCSVRTQLLLPSSNQCINQIQSARFADMFQCRGGVITSLAYHPSRNLAATTGSSGDIKMWVQQAERSKGRAAHWRCQSVGYHTGSTGCALVPRAGMCSLL